MLPFPDNPLLKAANVSVSKGTEGDNIEDLRRKLVAKESDIVHLKSVIACQQERIMELQSHLRNAPGENRFATITL